jgi:transcriptional regulator with XRE-family HTH domain
MKKIAPLPNNIQTLLDKKGLSMRELAKKMQLSPAHLARMINGDSPLTMKWIFKIAYGLKVKAIEVIGLKLTKAILNKYDTVLLGSIMGYLIEEANDQKVSLNIDELSELTAYICQVSVERDLLNDYDTRFFAIDAIQIKKRITN